MLTLFIDTSHYLNLGIFDESLSWIDFESSSEKKSSQIIHKLIFDLLSRNNFQVSHLSRIVYSAGPGSYTGIRVAKGIAEVFNLEGILVNNFWFQDLLTDLSIKDSCFISNAFKGEYFFAFLESGELKQKLIPINDVDLNLEKFSCCYICGDIPAKSKYEKFKAVIDLVKENPEDIFSKVFKENRLKEVFYYRALEEEFNKPKI